MGTLMSLYDFLQPLKKRKQQARTVINTVARRKSPFLVDSSRMHRQFEETVELIAWSVTVVSGTLVVSEQITSANNMDLNPEYTAIYNVIFIILKIMSCKSSHGPSLCPGRKSSKTTWSMAEVIMALSLSKLSQNWVPLRHDRLSDCILDLEGDGGRLVTLAYEAHLGFSDSERKVLLTSKYLLRYFGVLLGGLLHFHCHSKTSNT